MKSPQVVQPLKSSYIFFGEETFLLGEQLSSIRTLLGDGSSMNSASYHAQEIHHIDQVLSLCNTVPFLSDRRLVVVRNVHKLAQKDQDQVIAYLENPCDTTTLVLTIEGIREEKKFMKRCPQGVEKLPFEPLRARDFVDWIMGRVRMLRKSIDKDAAYLLADATAGNTWFAASEIEKLCLYVGNRASIAITDVEHLVMRSMEPPVFSFVDALFDRKKDVIIRLCELETSGITELEVISRIEKQAILHYQILCGSTAKGSGIHPFVEKKILSRKSLWDAPRLISLLGDIRRVEHCIKSGKSLHPYAAVHETVIRYVFPA